MNRKVEDLMQTSVKVVLEDESLIDLDRAFMDAKVSGFPVVNKDGLLVGIVTRSDIVRQLNVEQSISEYTYDYYHDVQGHETGATASLASIGERLGQRLEQLKIKDFMIRTVITIEPQASLQALAKLFLEHHIHRVPVTTNNKLVGIVTALDLVRLFAE